MNWFSSYNFFFYLFFFVYISHPFVHAVLFITLSFTVALFAAQEEEGFIYHKMSWLRQGFPMMTYLLQRWQKNGETSWRIKLREQGCSLTRQRKEWQNWVLQVDGRWTINNFSRYFKTKTICLGLEWTMEIMKLIEDRKSSHVGLWTHAPPQLTQTSNLLVLHRQGKPSREGPGNCSVMTLPCFFLFDIAVAVNRSKASSYKALVSNEISEIHLLSNPTK